MAQAEMVLPVVSHALEAVPVEPEQRGSFASSQAMIVGSFWYRVAHAYAREVGSEINSKLL